MRGEDMADEYPMHQYMVELRSKKREPGAPYHKHRCTGDNIPSYLYRYEYDIFMAGDGHEAREIARTKADERGMIVFSLVDMVAVHPEWTCQGPQRK